MKNRKFIVHYLDFNQLDTKLDTFLEIVKSNKKHNFMRQELVKKIISTSNKDYNQKMKETIFLKIYPHE